MCTWLSLLFGITKLPNQYYRNKHNFSHRQHTNCHLPRRNALWQTFAPFTTVLMSVVYVTAAFQLMANIFQCPFWTGFSLWRCCHLAWESVSIIRPSSVLCWYALSDCFLLYTSSVKTHNSFIILSTINTELKVNDLNTNIMKQQALWSFSTTYWLHTTY